MRSWGLCNSKMVTVKSLNCSVFTIPFLAEHSGPKQPCPVKGMYALFVCMTNLMYSVLYNYSILMKSVYIVIDLIRLY